MNQILKPELNIPEEMIYSNPFRQKRINKKQNRFYLFQFLISSSIAVCFLIVFFIRIFHLHEKEAVSNELIKTYQLSTLYANNMEYSAERIQDNSNNPYIATSTPFVIGMIKIDKINLNYPILSESNKELLNISVCRFSGPMPHEIGNLCIAGHNYVDYKFFSRLHELEKNDKMKLYDINGKMKEYTIFKKYEVKETDTSCTSQTTNGKAILTLLTCNNVSGKRLVLVSEPI